MLFRPPCWPSGITSGSHSGGLGGPVPLARWPLVLAGDPPESATTCASLGLGVIHERMVSVGGSRFPPGAGVARSGGHHTVAHCQQFADDVAR